MSSPLWTANDGSMEVHRDTTPEGPRLALYAPDIGEAPIQFLDRAEVQELVAAAQEWLASDCGVAPAKPALTAWEARQLAGMDASAPADTRCYCGRADESVRLERVPCAACQERYARERRGST